ncbi:IS3 family transposase [Cetobacterium sp. 2G large]|uniref:IS3 family transposase n=1 Tax=Cetobacterium sp. 2G large TaxID=2759680 RepID=UPI00163D0ABD|nr:IS3 family transposase [Cetobacterium sp. 2G large]
MKRIYEENSKIYGAPKIHVILNREGYPASIKLVQRITRAQVFHLLLEKSTSPRQLNQWLRLLQVIY